MSLVTLFLPITYIVLDVILEVKFHYLREKQ